MRKLGQASISTLVMAGFGTVMLFLIVISAVSLFNLMSVDRHFKDYRSLARQTVADGRVQANMLMTRIFAKNFVINASPDNIDGVQERAERTIEMIAQARSLTTDAGFQMVLDNLDRELDDYVESFTQVTAKQNERDKLVHDTLNVVGPQMEHDLTAIMQSAFDDGDTEDAYRAGMTMRNLLLARLYAGRFLIQNDNASFQRVGREFLEMQQNLDALVANLDNPDRLELAAKVRDEQRNYDRAFENVHDVITSRNSIIRNELDAIGPKVADTIERLKLALKETQDTLGPEAEAEIDRAVGIVMTIAIASILVGALAAWVIGFGVSRQVRSMAKTMKLLAGGDMDTEISAHKASSEIREMASAVEVFKASMIKVRELADEQRRAADEVRVAKDAADAANRAKSTFLANMSHELRTPMNAIMGYSEMLMEEAEDVGQDDFIPDLKRIHDAGSHLLSLINDVLDLSKIEAGKMEAFAEDFDLDALLEQVTDTAKPLMEKNDNRFRIMREGTLGNAHQDVTKVRQSLLNLLSNAAKFTHSGTVTLAAERESATDGDWLTLSVKDSGIGIPEDKLDTVFEEFSQADDSTSRDYGGTGLGLPLTRRFCELLGGDVRVESHPGKGSIFTMRIPATLPGTSTATPVIQKTTNTGQQPGAPEKSESKSTVLVIDDDPQARDIIKRILHKDGFDVMTADSGEEGLRIARTAQPIAITLDVQMPEMDGWTVLRLLKADPALRDIPVLMLSMIDDKGRGHSLGATDYLTKPVDRKQLQAALSGYQDAKLSKPLLLVEDDLAVRKLIAKAAEKIGWQVMEAGNGREALDCLAEQQPALILLDLIMPEMDGFEFLVEMRSHAEWRDLPVTVLTSKDLTEEDRRTLNGQVEQIVEKGPDSHEQVLEALHRLIEHHQ